MTLDITPQIRIAEEEISFRFVRASGPGGQNVNKVSTAVELRFDIRHSATLPSDVRDRLIRIAGDRVNRAGVLRIRAQRFRSQERNRGDALARFIRLVRRAAEPPKKRTPTHPTRASRERRLGDKHRRAGIKRLRRQVLDNED